MQVLLPEDPAEEGGTGQRARRQESVNADKSSKSIAEVCKYLSEQRFFYPSHCTVKKDVHNVQVRTPLLAISGGFSWKVAS